VNTLDYKTPDKPSQIQFGKWSFRISVFGFIWVALIAVTDFVCSTGEPVHKTGDTALFVVMDLPSSLAIIFGVLAHRRSRHVVSRSDIAMGRFGIFIATAWIIFSIWWWWEVVYKNTMPYWSY